MKILLDENVTHDLRHEITGHDCETVAYRGWRGIKNGELLQFAAAEGFDALVTNDTNLPYQQSQRNLPIAVIVLKAPSNDFEDIRPLVPKLLAAPDDLPKCRVTVVA
ncbi:hypothetical protein Pla175_36230 [Pirellulimonas nuda]|uniref:DUF5615 domain-containing protein n=1 Tax=Pirellulimonas nuda TaxID=2528009 RepID=A0A518DFG3_9BACT|nr:DUF5615 family PIN-like protein [Pirellulimonas nuda]QDU90221.1 hypothetical protein Pla175_36230 [Pirellulimonas nuda]